MSKDLQGLFKTGTKMAVISLAQSILALTGLVLLTQWISPDQFGEYAIGLTFLGLFQVISQFGIVQFSIHKPSLTNSDLNNLSRRLILSTVVFVGFFLGLLLLNLVGTILNQFPLYAETIAIWVFILILGNVASFNEALMLRKYKFFSVSKNNFIAFLFGNFLTPILLSKYYGLGYHSLIIGYFVFELLRVVLMENSIKLKLVFSEKSNELGGLRRFTVGFTVAKLGNYLALNSDNIILGSIMGTSALGVYSRAYQLVLAPVNLIYGVLDKIYFSVLSREQDDLMGIKLVYLQSVSVIFLVISPAVIGLSIFSEEIILLVFNTAWSELYIVFGVMILTVPFRLAYRLNDSVLRALGKVNRRAFIQWVYAGFVITAAYYSAFIDLQAVAIAISAVVILNYIMLTVLICSVLSISLLELLYWSFIPCIFLLSVLITVIFVLCCLFLGFGNKNSFLSLPIFAISSLIIGFSYRHAKIILRTLLCRVKEIGVY